MGTAIRKHYSVDQKVQIILELLKEEKTLSQLASAYGIHHSQITRWKNQVLDSLPAVFSPDHKDPDLRRTYERKMEALYQEIGQLTTQLTWLKKNPG